MSRYAEYGYFIDISLGSKAAKLLRAEIEDGPMVISLFVEPIFDDIFQQTPKYLKHESPSMFHFTPSKWKFLNYVEYSEIHRNGVIRLISSSTHESNYVKYFVSYIEALVFLYKYMNQSSEEIRNNTIKVNDMNITMFTQYMNAHKALHPEDFV